ncbi:MAG: aldehyde dehydrogenase family protein [Deltaproteobacteria bacterium]|nr:aldehyde dehydrogenase family protein [Deltaproteobacteria bacterium]
MTFVDGRLFVAGTLRDGPATTLRAPWDDAVIASVVQADDATLNEALDAGAAATTMMRALPAWRRRAILEAIAAEIAARAAQFEDTIVAEAGKPRRFAAAEVQRARATFALAAARCDSLDEQLVSLDGVAAGERRVALVRRLPRGLALAITPFNFPLNLVAHKLAPAFATGCPVLLKPAEQTPLSALLLAQVCRQAGLPDGGLSVVSCTRAQAARLVQDERPAIVSFTGSAAVGWDIKARAGKKTVCLELGGNAAVVVAADVDEVALDGVADKIVAGAFAYAGQVCISVQRVFVHRSRHAALRERLVARAHAVVCGAPDRADVVCGPLVDDRAVARVRDWCAEAVASGGVRLVDAAAEGGSGGDVGVGRLQRPQIVQDAPTSSRLYTDEVFGPVVTLHAFDALDEAFARVNDGRYGLQAGVFTSDVQVLLHAADALDVGAVVHDDVPTFRVDQMPYGGVKDSGLGREGIPWSFVDYTEARTLVLQRRP